MCIALKCDRCGKLYEPYNDACFNGFTTTQTYIKFNKCNRIEDYDLCPKCNRELSSWLNSFNTLDHKEDETK